MIMTWKKAQVSMEFIAFLGVMLFLLTLASYASLSAGSGIAKDNESVEARRIAATVAEEINLAVEIGPGYSHAFDLPAVLSTGTNYSINFTSSRFVYVFWGTGFYPIPVLSDNITGTVKNGRNTLTNNNGVIEFA